MERHTGTQIKTHKISPLFEFYGSVLQPCQVTLIEKVSFASQPTQGRQRGPISHSERLTLAPSTAQIPALEPAGRQRSLPPALQYSEPPSSPPSRNICALCLGLTQASVSPSPLPARKSRSSNWTTGRQKWVPSTARGGCCRRDPISLRGGARPLGGREAGDFHAIPAAPRLPGHPRLLSLPRSAKLGPGWQRELRRHACARV